MQYSLRLTESQHAALRAHLFPEDGSEAVALLLCGRRQGKTRHIFTVQSLSLVPHSACSVRAPDQVRWPTSFLDPLIAQAHGRGQAILKIHSHRTDYRHFSTTDDRSDREMYSSIGSLLSDGLPQASLIMLPSDEILGRALDPEGLPIAPLGSVMVVGDTLRIWHTVEGTALQDYATRTAQAFGSGTTALFNRLSAAVIGCSGTGSIVAEQLARLGIGRLVLIDPDTVEEKNLSRILNSRRVDIGRPKVEVLAEAIRSFGLGQDIVAITSNLATREAIHEAATCDIVLGCMDSAEGRHLLNRLATFYILPYFDVGVRLDADGTGGIDKIAGAVHYIQPGRSSLLSREVYSLDRVRSEELRRTDPALFDRQRKEGYLRGVDEERPAVISVNMFFASLLVNELLARLHPFRNHENGHFAYVGADLSEGLMITETEDSPDSTLARHIGRGDVTPLLERAALS